MADEHDLLLGSVVDALPNPVFVKDEQHRWVALNDAYCRFMGVRREDLLGKSDFDFFPPSEAKVFWAKDDAVFASGRLNQNEELFTDAEGHLHAILTRKSLLTTGGRRYLVGIITDLTERKRMEDELRRSRDELDAKIAERTAELRESNRRLKEADQRKNHFLAVLGHELRNPLTPIRTATTVLARAPANSPPFARALGIIQRQVAQMVRLIDDLLDVSRIARGAVSLQKRPVDLVALLRGVVEDARDGIARRKLHVQLSVPAAPLWASADPARITQAVGNLLVNAAKFTAANGHIEVSLCAEQDGAAISVRDDGIGIAREDQSRLFHPFSQLSTAQDRGGLGLGLSLVKAFIELHGGTVSVESEGEGHGSTFTLRLPTLRAAEMASDVAEAAARSAGQPPPARRRILVIEDNPDVAESVRMVLELDGHEVLLSGNGEHGLATALSFLPEIIFCDIGLPGHLSGLDVARRVRTTPELAATRLVAMTGFGRDEDRARARAAGFDRHLSKPFDASDLQHLIDELLPDGHQPPPLTVCDAPS